MQSYDCLIIRHGWSRQCAEALLCFLQGLAAEQRGCGVVRWFVTSEAALTTKSLYSSSTDCITEIERYRHSVWHMSHMWDARILCALQQQHAGFAFFNHHRLFNFILLMKNWWTVKPVEINDFQEICTLFWHVWSAIEKACKNAFVLCTAVCLRVCVHLYMRVCSYPTVWMEETSPEGYPFALITLMKLVEREGQRAFL